MTRRDLIKWGAFTATGALAFKNGLSPFAPSAYADDIPTGTPRTPLNNAQPYITPVPRMVLADRHKLKNKNNKAKWPNALGQRHSKKNSWHNNFTNWQKNNPGANVADNPFVNPVTMRGPLEGRAPGKWFRHQRWEQCFPEVGFLLSLGQIEEGVRFHPALAEQGENAIWTFGQGGLGTRGHLPPLLAQMRYGEPMVARVYNSAPVDRHENGGFGRNEFATHFHNAHNASASDGASNCHQFPGTFYDYHWPSILARYDDRDEFNNLRYPVGYDLRSSGLDDDGYLMPVAGDCREAQGSMWFHDHRFFFTAENVYKGHLALANQYSGPDCGYERSKDDGTAAGQEAESVNLRLPSGWRKSWGNVDFDVNLLIADWATDQDGQYFFDIFNTDGFLGDNLHVNFAYKPYMDVLPRKYRLRTINTCMSRFIRLCLVNMATGQRVPVKMIANDGNFLTSPVTLTQLDVQGNAERYDIIVDFSAFPVGSTLQLVNVLEHDDGRGPKETLSLNEAMSGEADDPAVGPLMEFRVVSSVASVDNPNRTNTIANSCGAKDHSQVPFVLTEQIPIVQPDRVRHIEWKRGGNDSYDAVPGGGCIPECELRGDPDEAFPWAVRVNGEETHALNANRISSLIPEPNTVEHWTIENGGGGWDHPIHLHFEEGVTMNRGGDSIPDTEYLVRKDVWRLREGGEVTFQVKFGEFGGSYVSHCHNTVHEDFAMLMRFDVLNDHDGIHGKVPRTPNPTPDGVEWLKPEILPEGDPDNSEFFFEASLEDDDDIRKA